MTNQKKDLPKIPPFVIEGTAGVPAREPASQPVSARHVTSPATRSKRQHVSLRGMLSVLMLLISAISLGIAMAGGAWIGFNVLEEGLSNQTNILPRIIPRIGLLDRVAGRPV